MEKKIRQKNMVTSSVCNTRTKMDVLGMKRLVLGLPNMCHLECLKYLHENGCPWNEGTCSFVALRGHLECLKYAHENGCIG